MPVSATRSRDGLDFTPYEIETEDAVCQDPTSAGNVGARPTVDAQSPSELDSPGDAAPPTDIAPYAVAQATGDVVTVGAGALRGRDSRSGVELDVFDVSARASGRTGEVGAEGQATMAHLGMSRDDGRLAFRGDAFSANAHVGTKNADGSRGFNVGAAATIVSGEATIPLGESVTLTVGAAAAVGASLSIGVRDADHDGKAEICGRVEYLWGIAGLCVEKPF